MQHILEGFQIHAQNLRIGYTSDTAVEEATVFSPSTERRENYRMKDCLTKQHSDYTRVKKMNLSAWIKTESDEDPIWACYSSSEKEENGGSSANNIKPLWIKSEPSEADECYAVACKISLGVCDQKAMSVLKNTIQQETCASVLSQKVPFINEYPVQASYNTITWKENQRAEMDIKPEHLAMQQKSCAPTSLYLSNELTQNVGRTEEQQLKSTVPYFSSTPLGYEAPVTESAGTSLYESPLACLTRLVNRVGLLTPPRFDTKPSRPVSAASKPHDGCSVRNTSPGLTTFNPSLASHLRKSQHSQRKSTISDKPVPPGKRSRREDCYKSVATESAGNSVTESPLACLNSMVERPRNNCLKKAVRNTSPGLTTFRPSLTSSSQKSKQWQRESTINDEPVPLEKSSRIEHVYKSVDFHTSVGPNADCGIAGKSDELVSNWKERCTKKLAETINIDHDNDGQIIDLTELSDTDELELPLIQGCDMDRLRGSHLSSEVDATTTLKTQQNQENTTHTTGQAMLCHDHDNAVQKLIEQKCKLVEEMQALHKEHNTRLKSLSNIMCELDRCIQLKRSPQITVAGQSST
ncbi:uncharacterized protein LOC103034753 [Astyanax mexicanus]|uniref:uncharacterized protein LOC103034753 n=1 Tax=Astyanax mexicanus TaxID=7994 RepID=UPI0020CAAE67|nr:uncharacterized protein LOC103034753 [Astyanax mexicanus]